MEFNLVSFCFPRLEIFILLRFSCPCIFNSVMNVYETSHLRTLLLCYRDYYIFNAHYTAARVARRSHDHSFSLPFLCHDLIS
jgi:hypothetical protein